MKNSLLGESKERNLEQKCNSHFGTNSTPTKHYHPSYLYTNEKKSGGGGCCCACSWSSHLGKKKTRRPTHGELSSPFFQQK